MSIMISLRAQEVDMKKSVFGILFLFGQMICTASFAHEAPKSIGPVTLGANVSDLQAEVDVGASVPLGGADFLMRAPLKSLQGFESGYVVYGKCKEKGRVVRVKLKYEDDEVRFFNEVLAALRKRYGKPTEWKGNPFGTLKIWKWSLRDARLHSIGLQLQYYEGDDDAFTPGNSIKLTHTTYLEEEKACYDAKKKSVKRESKPGSPEVQIDFESYLPH
jgi:hypothetical protein